MKRKLLLILTMLFAMIGTLAFAAACGGDSEDEKNDLVAGEEAGEYYADVEGKEYTLTLTETCTYKLVLGGDPIEGNYIPDGEDLTFNEGEEVFAGTYQNDTVTLYYHSVTYKFLRKIEYTVTFETDGGSTVPSITVMNGKTAAKPGNPTKGDQVFVGWYTDRAYKSAYRFTEAVKSNLTLYAHFVTPIEPEYTVTFDLNGAEGNAPASIKTVGHQAFELPTPVWTGHTFVGWWVSHYNDATKLTYQYKEDNEQLLSGDTTLYAVWAGDAPAISIGEKEITWTSAGTNVQYRIAIKNLSADKDVRNTTASQTRLAFDFAAQDPGEYAISVSVGNDAAKTATAYYKNRTLEAVSKFWVEGDTLFFNAVEHATGYLIEVDCGDPNHQHDNSVHGADECYFDFSACAMPANGIHFTVTAQADGYLSSTAEHIVRRELDTVTDFSVNANEVLTWKAVPNAASYDVVIKQGDATVYNGTVVDCSLPLKGYDKGRLDITVTPKALGWNSPDPAAYSHDKATLAAPSNLHLILTTSMIDWDDVKDAKGGYEVKIGDHDAVTVNSSEIKFDETYHVDGKADYAVTVRALTGTGSGDSLWSDDYTVRYGELGDTLTYRNGVISWDPVFGVSKYYLSVNGGAAKEYTEASAPVTFTAKGTYTFKLSTVAEPGADDKTISVSVEVYAISFDANGGDQTPDSLYLANGDSMTLPTGADVTLYGYDLEGWYSEATSGSLYDNNVFLENNDRTLYAHWTPKTFHVKLVVGVYGDETDFPAEVTVTYRQTTNLPIPKSSDPTKGFTGWYDSPTGEVPFTKADGKITYMQGSDITLYARWVNLFTFELTDDNSGYQVSKSADLDRSGMSEITIPATYQGRPVKEVIDFTDCTKLEIIHIPDTIQLIAFEAGASAFSGCDKLLKIIIDKTDDSDSREVKYYDEDGILFYHDVAGRLEIRFYSPLRPETSYEIPEGVEVIPSYALMDIVALEELTIPYTVTEIQTMAIGYEEVLTNRPLKTMTFLATPAGKQDVELKIYENAFYTLRNLKNLTFPSRLTELDFYKMFGDKYESSDGAQLTPTQLDQLLFVGTGGKYSTPEPGLVLEDLGSTDGYKLLYYPAKATEFKVDGNVTKIGDNAVRDNKNLTALVIPSQIVEIGSYAFAGTTKVTSLEFKGGERDGKLAIKDHAFYSCGSEVYSYSYSSTPIFDYLKLPENLDSLAAYSFGKTQVTTVELNSKATIADGAFNGDASYDSSKVKKIIIGAGVKDVNFSAVFGNSVADIDVADDHPYYTSETIGEGETKHKLIYIKGTNGEKTELAWFSSLPESYQLPETITRIGANTFKDCLTLKSITIPASVTYIGNEAFAGTSTYSSECMQLAEVTFADAAGAQASLTIGDKVFANCVNLKEITFPEGLTGMGKQVFDGCSALAKVHFPATLESIQSVTETKSAYNGPTWTEKTLGMFPENGSSNALAEITVAEGSHFFSAKDDAFYMLREEQGKYVESELMYFAPRSDTTALVIPNTVRNIWSYAFYAKDTTYSNKLESVTFSEKKLAQMTQKDSEGNPSLVDGTLEIGYHAFDGAAKLSTIELPEGTERIREYAFGDNNFKTFTFPGTVKSIGFAAVTSAKYLTTVTFAAGTEPLVLEDALDAGYSYAGLFSDCERLQKVELPERTTKIGESAFQLSSVKFTELVIPSTVTTIGEKAFYDAEISKITFKTNADGTSSLDSIGKWAFWGSAVTEILLPASVTKIGERAFDEATALESFIVPDNARLTTIGDMAFWGCTSLHTVKFGKNSQIRALNESIFKNCISLTEIEIPITVEEIGAGAFGGTALTSLTFEERDGEMSKLHFFDRAFAGGTYPKAEEGKDPSAVTSLPLETFSFPETEGEILLGDNVFGGADNLTTVYISSKIYSLNDAFDGLTKITKITVAKENPSYEVDASGQPFLKSKENGDIVFVFGKLQGRLEIEAGSIQIGASAFMNTEITEVFIPRSVMRIGDHAFENCKLLTKVEFEDGSSINSIGEAAFNGCVLLKDIDFTKTKQLSELVSYGYSANTFKDCEALVTLDFSATRLETIPANALAGCTNLTTLRLPRTFTAFEYKTGSDYYDPPTNVMDTVLGHTKIASLDLSNTGVEEVPQNFFKGSEYLQEIRLPITLSTIGPNAFNGCTKLTALDLTAQSSLTEISYYAFANCENLASITLPASVKTLRSFCFDNCGLITSIDLSGIETIELGAFHNTGLTEVTLPASIKRLGGGKEYVYSEDDDWHGPGWSWEDISTSSSSLSASKGIFGECLKLKKVTFASGMAEDVFFNGYTFAGCTALDTVTFETGCGVGTLANYMFKDCTALERITLPASLVNLTYTYSWDSESNSYADHLFDGCTGLKYADLSACEATTLYSSGYIFNGCINLETVKFPRGLTSIPSLGDSGTTFAKLTTVELPEKLTSIPSSYFSGCILLTEIMIPASVTSIGYAAFSNTGLKSIELPAGLGKLEGGSYLGGVFADCASLATVTFAPNSVITEIGAKTFLNCTSLTEISLPATVTTIGASAFEGSRITSITIPASVTKMAANIFKNCGLTSVTLECGDILDASSSSYSPSPAQSVFKDCTDLGTVTITGAMTTIGASFFEGCTSLTTVTLPESVTTIGDSAFKNCAVLENIDMDHITSIGLAAFDGCDKLFEASDKWTDGVFYLGNIIASVSNDKIKEAGGTVNIRTGVTALGDNLFADLTELKKIVLSDTVETLGESVFKGCTALTDADFTKATKLTALSDYLFRDCTALSKVDLPAGITSIGTYCFANTGLTSFTVPATATDLWSNIFAGSKLQSVTFAEAENGKGLTSIPSYMFQNCTDLATVTLNNTITSIGRSAFDGCEKLTSIDLHKVETIGASAFKGTGLTSLTLPDTVKGIGESAFANCASLATVTLSAALENPSDSSYSSTVQGLSTSAFTNCILLTQIDFTKCTKLTKLADSLFKGCEKLETVTLPDTITWIGANCFEGTGIKSIKLPDTVSTIDTGAFKGTALTEITLPKALTNGIMKEIPGEYYWEDSYYVWSGGFGNGVFENCESLAQVTFPEGSTITELSDSTFKGCVALETISLPANMTKIGANCFDGTSLTSIKLDDTITRIGDSAFKGTKITEVTLPKSLKDKPSSSSDPADGFGNGVFENCESLATVTFPEGMSLTELGDNVFKGCTALSAITLPDSLTTIGISAFEGCTLLRELRLPYNVRSLNNKFLSGCSLDVFEIAGEVAPYERCMDGLVSIKTLIFADGTKEINYNFESLVALKGLEKVIIPKSVEAISLSYGSDKYGAFDKLPDTVTLCFLGSEEDMTDSFGEIGWTDFKNRLPENAKVIYSYDPATDADSAN